jgi:hypothetical protein
LSHNNDLFRTPVLSEQLLNSRPGCISNTRRPTDQFVKSRTYNLNSRSIFGIGNR